MKKLKTWMQKQKELRPEIYRDIKNAEKVLEDMDRPRLTPAEEWFERVREQRENYISKHWSNMAMQTFNSRPLTIPVPRAHAKIVTGV